MPVSAIYKAWTPAVSAEGLPLPDGPADSCAAEAPRASAPPRTGKPIAMFCHAPELPCSAGQITTQLLGRRRRCAERQGRCSQHLSPAGATASAHLPAQHLSPVRQHVRCCSLPPLQQQTRQRRALALQSPSPVRARHPKHAAWTLLPDSPRGLGPPPPAQGPAWGFGATAGGCWVCCERGCSGSSHAV